MNNSKPEGLDLTDLLKQIIEHNGAPLFDLAIQVDDRNTSRYVLNIGLPRHSGIMPQFYSNIPKVDFIFLLKHFIERFRFLPSKTLGLISYSSGTLIS